MSPHNPRKATTEVLELAPQLTIADAADLHRNLKARAAAGAPLIIDGTRVKQIDTAILQLLVSSFLSWTQRGIACGWQGASDTLRSTAVLIGVAEQLNLSGARKH